MDQIRFNQPPQRQMPSDRPVFDNQHQSSNGGMGKKVLKALALILVVCAVAVLVFLVKDKVLSSSVTVENGASPYSAVFLSNGQVYFGKLMEKNSNEFVLSEVYYLQLSENGTQTADSIDPKFSLIKLGNEIHGPTDKLHVNASQVLFYESLRQDSLVVQSIKNQK